MNTAFYLGSTSSTVLLPTTMSWSESSTHSLIMSFVYFCFVHAQAEVQAGLVELTEYFL